jgi:hypothetical protein
MGRFLVVRRARLPVCRPGGFADLSASEDAGLTIDQRH